MVFTTGSVDLLVFDSLSDSKSCLSEPHPKVGRLQIPAHPKVGRLQIPAMSKEELQTQPIDTPYTPKKHTPQMWCICTDKQRRISFIIMVKEMRRQARAVFEAWKRGETSLRYPPGMFPPSMPKLANLLPGAF